MKRNWRTLFFSFLFVTLCVAQAVAADPPGRVARLQYLSGDVSVQPGGEGEWSAGAVNRPLTSGDNIWADKNSRAELNDGSALLRIDSESSLTLVNVGDNTVQARLHQGVLNLHVRHLLNGEIYEIDTPKQAFMVQSSGDYRFAVDEAGNATITVWKGKGDVTGTGNVVHLGSGEQARFEGDATRAAVTRDPQKDGFDDWCLVRDKREDTSVSAEYVAPDTIGYEDLDANGVWTEAAPYGHIWVPSVSVGWEPYRLGHWVWIDPWGWTWVEDEPWGFAPFHYGRWVYWHDRWGWAPGPRGMRSYYAPAMVAWFGGRHWGVGIGIGGGIFGWCPLGWGEPFYPWYHGGRRYFDHVNRSNTHFRDFSHMANNFNNGGHAGEHYAYASHMTAVNGEAMRGSLSVSRNLANVSARDLASHPINGRMDMAQASAGRMGGGTAMRPGSGAAGAIHNNLYAPKPSGAGTQRAMQQQGGSQGAGMRQQSTGAAAGRDALRSSVPRPPQNMTERSGSNNAANPRGSTNMRSVPRPTGPVAPAGHYAAPTQSQGGRSVSGGTAQRTQGNSQTSSGYSRGSQGSRSSSGSAARSSATSRSQRSSGSQRSQGSSGQGGHR